MAVPGSQCSSGQDARLLECDETGQGPLVYHILLSATLLYHEHWHWMPAELLLMREREREIERERVTPFQPH